MRTNAHGEPSSWLSGSRLQLPIREHSNLLLAGRRGGDVAFPYLAMDAGLNAVAGTAADAYCPDDSGAGVAADDGCQVELAVSAAWDLALIAFQPFECLGTCVGVLLRSSNFKACRLFLLAAMCSALPRAVSEWIPCAATCA
eukprot:scpid51626/ scgid8303/ 